MATANKIRTADQLEDEANSLVSGHLKTWKAHDMWRVLTDIPMNLERLEKYVTNCLYMEGFSLEDCKSIAKKIQLP
jgi:hypothetical protein